MPARNPMRQPMRFDSAALPTGRVSAEPNVGTSRRDWIRNVVGVSSALAAMSLFAQPARAAEDPTQPSTSDEAKQAALAAIPWATLSPESQARIHDIVDRPSIYRKMPVEVMACDPELYLFLIRNPEIIVNIWKVMGVSTVTLTRTGAFSLKASDGQGTKASVELIYGDANTHVMLGDGAYDGSMLARNVAGKCILLLQSGYTTSREGRSFVTSRLDMFLTLDRAGIELIARTMQHLVGTATDGNFLESFRFISRIHETAEQNGPGVKELAGKLDQCHPDKRAEFAQHAMRIHHAYQEQIAKMGGEPPTSAARSGFAMPMGMVPSR